MQEFERASFHKEMVEATLSYFDEDKQEVLCEILEKVNKFFEKKYEGLQ